MSELTPFRINKITRDVDDFLDPSSRIDFINERLDSTPGTPTHFYMDESNSIVLGPVPEAVETLNVKLNLRPSDIATTLPDTLYDNWRRAIAAGARIWIRENYDTWVNDDEMAKDIGIFESAITEAKSQREKGRTRFKHRAKAYFQ